MTRRPVAALLSGLLLAAFLLPPTAGAQEMLPTDRTDPGHLRPPFSAYEAPQPGREPRPRRTESRRVYALPQGLKGLATFDRTLSHLCQRGAFLQEIDGLYWAATPEFRYGVAFSGGANLVDPQNRRQPGKVYFFRNQDSRCSVWVGDQAKLMPHHIGG
ncbi:hypothetical protein A6A40_22005 (plasmid) [Azospirillum humicireducens]|uniref:Secreted protein n=1 Tax=Azospirillum humicireducens TaxID=1226968 RepID=A0A2R4VTB1_9PROT|nr:hypothetical protein [Azospirillum humicireducens]AWB07664.1 hypothetical protein A6A40_22005 [Azospirillum humicireducens]